MTLILAGLIFSCKETAQSPQSGNEAGKEALAEQNQAYQMLFAELDDLVTTEADISSPLMVPYSPNLQSNGLRVLLQDKKTSLEKFWDGVVIIASDAIGAVGGGLLGSVAGPEGIGGGAILGGVAASRIVAKELGYEVTPDTTIQGGLGISIALSSQLPLRDGSFQTIGEAHNFVLANLKLENAYQYSDEEIYNQVRNVVATTYKFKESELPQESPLSFDPKELITVIHRPNVETYEDLVQEIAGITHLPANQVNFILTSSLNNYQLALEQKDLKSLNVNISEMVEKSSLTEAEKKTLIDATSVATNSAVYWKDVKTTKQVKP